MKRLVSATLFAVLLAGCAAPNTTRLGIAPVASQAPAARPALASVPVPASRLLAEGAFTLSASLVSIGTGGLVSIGSGGLVSVGSGGIVSVGSGGYRLQAAEASGDVAVAGALIALSRPRGEALDAALEVAGTQSDAQGAYRLHGRAPAGVYRVSAAIGGHTFMTLVALSTDAPAQAPVDAATTLVAARLLADDPTGDLTVLPMGAFAEAVAAVRVAIAAGALPANWTPAQAAATMAALARSHAGVGAALNHLREAQASLVQREAAIQYQLQEIASALGVPHEVVAAEARAVLSTSPDASDAEIEARVRDQASAPAPASSAAPGAAAPPTGSAAPTTTGTPAPTTGTPAPAASTTPADTQTPGAPATPGANGAPPAHGAQGATQDDAAIEEEMAREKQKATGNPSKHGQGASPTPAPSPTPSASATPGPTPGDEPSPAPTATPTADAGQGGGTGNAGGNGQGGGTGNAGGNGDAGGTDNGGNNGNNGNGNANGQNGSQGEGNGGQNNGNGNGNANGQNGTQGEGNGGQNNGNGNASQGNRSGR